MKKQFRIASKYLIEKSKFFSKQQLVLFLQENHLHMQPLSRDREESEGGVTKIDWDSIVSVQASERNPKEFTIFTMPPNKKKGSSGKQGTPQQEVFSCKERNRLLTEMIHKLHILNDEGKPQLATKAYHQSDIYKANSKRLVSIRIHPTVIQVVINSNPKSLSKNTEEKKAYNGSKKQKSSLIKEESKKLFEDDDDMEDSGEEKYGEEDNLFEEEEDDEQDILEYESVDQAMGPNTVLTPFKGSMLGGTVIGEGEESIAPGMILESQVKQHFIYLSEIDRVFAITNYLIIIKKNQEIEKFIFKSEEKMKEILSFIKKNHRDHFKTNLFYFNFQSFEQDKIFTEIEFLKRGEQIIYKQDVNVYTWDGIIGGIQLEIDENYIYEVEKSENRVRKRCLLKDLEIIRILDKQPLYNLVLLFKKETEIVMKVPSLVERERLLSAILTLRSFSFPPTGHIDQVNILINQGIDFAQRILGHDPVENTQYIQEYEGLLFRKISENINYKDHMKINNLIEEALLNASFISLAKIDTKNIRIIVKEIQLTLEQFLTFEMNDPHIVDQVLKRSQDDYLIDYFGYKKKAQQQQFSHFETNNNVMSQPGDTNSAIGGQMFIDEAGDKAKHFSLILERVSKYLNVMNIFLNSKVFMADMAEHEDVMLLLIKCLMSKSPYIGLLASQCLKGMVHHYSGNESRIESINKRIMIRGKLQHQQQQSGAQDQLSTHILVNNQDLGENLYLVHAIYDYLQYFDHLHEQTNKIKSLHFFNICNILRSVLNVRRVSTGREELQIFANFIIEEEHRIPSSVDKSSIKLPEEQKASAIPISKVKDDPLRNKALFHLVDKFCLLGKDHFDIKYLFTLILNESLGYFKKFETDKLYDFQMYILTYSVQFLWHLYQIIDSPIKEQRKVSIHFLTKVLYLNSESIQLLLRCYPKTLIERVETPMDLSQSMAWQETEWEDFFNLVTQKKFDTATEQWNDETRAELKAKIEQELNEFIEAKKIHKMVIQDGNRRDLILPNHEFNRQNKVISRCLNLKWNYMEFQVKHTSLNNKYLVWKYYLTKLLEENNQDERKKPQFACDIQKPVIFWNELKIKFMSSFDKDEQRIILKAMCVLYNAKYPQLNELKSIPYWLKLLDQDQFHHCHFILLQLMHIALSVNGEYGLKNMKKFIKNDGLQILNNCMKLVFKELNKNDVHLPSLSNGPSLEHQYTLGQQQQQVDNTVATEVGPAAAVGVMRDQANYTNSETNSRYFKRNSENVCMGILSLKILDLIFKEMNKIDFIPLPTNMEFLMRPDSLATLTQMYMIENTDLTRELTIFMHMHMNNHFSFYKMINSCMIELLIRCLCTRNGDRALDLLEKFQEVHINYNTNLKLGLFNSNDLKMIQDDKHRSEDRIKTILQTDKVSEMKELYIGDLINKIPILGESLFLRFLPIPFIKFLYEKGKNKFLEVYKMNNYESPILIWNAELRGILENAIKEHTHEFIQLMREFAKLPNKELKDPERLPHYKKPFKNIVRYPSIENEVRCGRYYLRVWVNQKIDSEDFFKIPKEEEDEFQNNLQAELRHCIYEDQFQDQQKIIILFKACLLIFKTREKNKILSLDEVQRILIKTCRDQTEYNDTVKQIVYLGIKIIINSFNITLLFNSNDYLSAMKKNTQSAKYVIDDNFLKVALTKTGVDICQKIFQLILSNSFRLKRKSMKKKINVQSSEEDIFDGNNAESQSFNEMFSAMGENTNKIVIDRIEAKTLSLCVRYLNIVLNNDIQDFVDLPLSQRIGLFKQISRVFDLGNALLPLFKNRVLTNFEQYVDSKTYSSSYFNMHSNLSPNTKSKKKSSSKRKSKKRNQQKQPKLPVLTTNQSNQNIIMEYQSMKNMKEQIIQAGKTTEYREELLQRKQIYKQDPNIDYKQQTLLKIIKQHSDNYSIQLIMNLQRNIFELTREVTKNPMLHPELIASGMAWKAIQQIYFNLKEEKKKFRDLDISIKSASITLKNLISFAKQIAEKGAESFAFKNLTKETEQDIILNFWQSINRIFSSKILETLTQTQFIITSNLLSFPNYDPRKFLRLFSVLEEKSPELVWNNETRQELASVLDHQIKNLDMGRFCDLIIDFEYSVNKRELRVNNIFVRHFNTTVDFKLYDVNEFAQSLILKIKEIVNKKDNKEQDLFQDLNQCQMDNCIELVKAFKNLLEVKELQIEDQAVFEDNISVFCDLIRVQEQGELDQKGNIDSLKIIFDLVIDILKHISKSGGVHFEYIKDNIDFIRLLIRCLYGNEKDVVNMFGVISIMKNLLNYESLNVEVFLIRTGLIYFILNQIFDKNVQKIVRVELIQVILQTSQYTKEIYKKYIPAYFFVEIQSKYNNDLEVEKLIELINNFDAPSFANVFIIWNTQLKKEIHQRIKGNCEKIIEVLNQSKFEFDLDDSEIHNPYLEHEIRVSDVILRIYNENPAIYINIKLNTFILNLSKQLQKVAQELFRMFQSDDKYFYPDFVPQTKLQQQNQKKFKYICYQSGLLLTSILLSIEQLLYNDFNPNRLMATKKEDKNAQTKFYNQIIEKTTEQAQLDNQFYPILGFWLQTQVFLSKQMPVEIRLTFLQIIFLVIEMNDAIKILKDNQCLMQFITDSIEKINADKFQKTLEEALILFITQKMLRKDSDPTPTLITTSMNKLIKIHDKKKKLKKLVEFIFILMCQDSQYKQAVITAIQQNQSSKIDPRILQEKQEHSENTEAIMRIWRQKPTSQSDAKTYFDFRDCYYIEDKLEEQNILKIKLPLLSKNSVNSIKKEDVFIEESKQQIDPSAFNASLGQDIIITGQSRFNKASQLGFQPLIDDEDIDIIGGNDIEAIEKKSEDGLEDSSDELE